MVTNPDTIAEEPRFIEPARIETYQKIQFRTGDVEEKRDCVCLSGYAVFNFEGKEPGNSWHCITLKIPRIGPRWYLLGIDNVCASVAPASISNSGRAEDAGWAVDYCKVDREGGRITLRSRICVRDTDGLMQRVVFHVNAVGAL